MAAVGVCLGSGRAKFGCILCGLWGLLDDSPEGRTGRGARRRSLSILHPLLFCLTVVRQHRSFKGYVVGDGSLPMESWRRAEEQAAVEVGSSSRPPRSSRSPNRRNGCEENSSYRRGFPLPSVLRTPLPSPLCAVRDQPQRPWMVFGDGPLESPCSWPFNRPSPKIIRVR